MALFRFLGGPRLPHLPPHAQSLPLHTYDTHAHLPPYHCLCSNLPVCDALVEAGVFPESSPPNHVLLNEYSDGQGIGAPCMYRLGVSLDSSSDGPRKHTDPFAEVHFLLFHGAPSTPWWTSDYRASFKPFSWVGPRCSNVLNTLSSPCHDIVGPA